jgi:hypothetical protein
MTASESRVDRRPEGPALHVVPDPVDTGPLIGHHEDVEPDEELDVQRDHGTGDTSSEPHHEETPLEEARRILDEADPVATYRMVSGLARPSHHSVLQALSYTPALSFHDPSCVVVDPEPMGIETPELYARTAYPDFDRVLLDAFTAREVAATLTSLYHLLVNEGANVALVTNHGQIIDIALVIAALQSALMQPDRTFGVLGDRITQEEWADRTNVLVSRMVTSRQAFSIPAVQVLQSAARTFLSIPQTASRRRTRFDASITRANNTVMRHELDQRLIAGGQLVAMAASGSQDLALPRLVHRARAMWKQRRGDDPGEAPTLHLQPLYDGTVTLMRSCRYVLPVAISLDPAAPACVIGDLTMVREQDDCHRLMDWIAMAHQGATGVPTLYHWHEDDLLTQVRAFLNR